MLALTLLLAAAAPLPPAAGEPSRRRRPAAARVRSRKVAAPEPDPLPPPPPPQPVIVVPDPPPPPVIVLASPPPPPPPPPPPGDPRTIPPPIRSMLNGAMGSGDEGAVNTIVRFAGEADPGSRDAVLRLAAQWRERRARERDQRLRSASAFELWTGRIEAGGFISTGNSDVTGITGVADLQREALQWRHKLHLQADYQSSNGLTSREHYVAAYEPNFKLDPGRYVYGNVQFESDRFLGYNHRFSGSLGAGFNALQTPELTLALELGPAFRYTQFTNDRVESSVAARGNLDLDWTIASGLVLSTDASAYFQRFNSTLSGTGALAAKLIGPLSARLSYTVQYESEPPVGRLSTDTTSRASLVYSF